MEGSWFHRKRFPFYLILSLLLQGRGVTFTINCSEFGRHGADPTALNSVFERRAFRPVTNVSVPTRVNISFTMSAILDVDEQLHLLSSFLWLEMVRTPLHSLPAVTIKKDFTQRYNHYKCLLDNMLLGMEKEVWEITDTSRNILQAHGEWELLGINKATAKMSVGANLYDQIAFYVAIRRRPSLYIINLLVPSGFLLAIDALSFYLPVESGNRVPFKITLLLGYNVFLLMMNDLLPTSGTPLISVYFALCLSLMVLSLLETVFITHLLHMATTQSPPLPRWLHSLLLSCTSPGRCCPTAPQKRNEGLGLTPTHLPGAKEPEVSAGQRPGPGVAEPTGGSEWTRVQREHGAQRQRSVALWVQFSHAMDALLFRLYLLFLASSILTVVGLWNT
uniref:5-hydroxytryptamine receptor 3E n=1 Tax=Saimiri boliviensis boliviensis TaxID=39432 RepID=A0A2K6SML1_SAIBB